MINTLPLPRSYWRMNKSILRTCLHIFDTKLCQVSGTQISFRELINGTFKYQCYVSLTWYMSLPSLISIERYVGPLWDKKRRPSLASVLKSKEIWDFFSIARIYCFDSKATHPSPLNLHPVEATGFSNSCLKTQTNLKIFWLPDVMMTEDFKDYHTDLLWVGLMLFLSSKFHRPTTLSPMTTSAIRPLKDS